MVKIQYGCYDNYLTRPSERTVVTDFVPLSIFCVFLRGSDVKF